MKRRAQRDSAEKLQNLDSDTFNKKQEPIIECIGQDKRTTDVKSRNRFMVSLFPSLITKSMHRRVMSDAASTLLTFLADCTWQRLSLSLREGRKTSINNKRFTLPYKV
jgi:hypothetical protein